MFMGYGSPLMERALHRLTVLDSPSKGLHIFVPSPPLGASPWTTVSQLAFLAQSVLV